MRPEPPAAPKSSLLPPFQELPIGAPANNEVYRQMQANARDGPTYLVWYGSGYDNVADLDDILDLFRAEVVTSQPDGAVYRLRGEADE